MKMLNLISIGERAGSGVPDIFSVWNEKGWIEPDVQEQYNPDRTILTLAFLKKQAIKTSDKKQAIKASDKKQAIKTEQHIEDIIEYLKTVGEAGASEIAEHIHLGRDRTKLTDYYQYRAPMIDSIHSADCKLSKKDQDELIAKMLSDACLKTRKVPYIRGGIDNNHSVNGCSGYSLPHHV